MTETKQATYKAIVLSKLGTTVEQGKLQNDRSSHTNSQSTSLR